MLIGVDSDNKTANLAAFRVADLNPFDGTRAMLSKAGECRQNNTDTYSRKPIHCTLPQMNRRDSGRCDRSSHLKKFLSKSGVEPICSCIIACELSWLVRPATPYP